MTVSVSTLVLRSMRLTGEKGRGASLTSDETTEILNELNSFMDSCALERLLCYQVLQESFSLATNTASYTIGSGGTFNTARPTRIVDPCFTRDANSLDTPLRILTDPDSYGKIQQKGAGTTYPEYLFYDRGFNASSLGTISISPTPSANLTLFINSWKQLGTFSTMSMQVSLPPGYQLFVESNFAIHLCAGNVAASPELIRIARDSKANVKSVNLPEPVMRLDTGLVRGRRTNIYTG